MQEAPGLRDDARGAVFVEKLIVYLPLMMVFFAAWELAELAAASLIVQRASSAAGRAATVVLADDPLYYGDEPVGSYDGDRRRDIELAAGMILSANPRLTSDFDVDLEPPTDSGETFDVTLNAPYSCGVVSLLCGADKSIMLTSTTQHTYQGAHYQYTMLASAGNFHAGARARRDRDGEGDDFRSGERGTDDDYLYRAGQRTPDKFDICKNNMTESQLAAAGVPKWPTNKDPNLGTKLKTPYGQPGSLSYEALKYRCIRGSSKSKNIAVLTYSCDGLGTMPPLAAESGWDENPNKTNAGTPENWDHSEQNLIRKFERAVEDLRKAGKNPKNCKITSFYTERDPCYNSGGASCQDFFHNGGTNFTKAPDINMSPAEIKKLRGSISFHYEYNNNYKQFDQGTCDSPGGDPMPPNVKAFCQKLKDKDKVCKKVGAGNGQDCKAIQANLNKRAKQEANADETYKKAKEKYDQRIACGQRATEPKKPDHSQDLNEADAKACLEIANLEQNLVDSSVRNTARDDIDKAMKKECDDIKKRAQVLDPATPPPANCPLCVWDP